MTDVKMLLSNGDSGRAAVRLLASQLIVEATERGDLDFETVDWAVNRLLGAANEAERYANRAQSAPSASHDQGRYVP